MLPVSELRRTPVAPLLIEKPARKSRMPIAPSIMSELPEPISSASWNSSTATSTLRETELSAAAEIRPWKLMTAEDSTSPAS